MKEPTQSSDLNDLVSARGTGGEIRQHAQGAAERLTTAQGLVIADNQNALRAGAPGPALLEDFARREKIFHIDHERIPERVVHARGFGAHGTVTCTRAMADAGRHRRDLWDAIDRGDLPKRNPGVQLFDQAFADGCAFDVLDPTRLVPAEDCPAEKVFAETEPVAFRTAIVTPGIDFADDPLLQGRNFSYLDIQLKRRGGRNFTKIPVNAPKGCPVSNYPQDGHMQPSHRRGRVNCEPNGRGEGPRAHPLEGYVSFRALVTGDKARLRPERFADHYSQPREFYISQTVIEQGHIVADRPGLADLPAPAARPTRADLNPPTTLGIQSNPPDSLKGRVMGMMPRGGLDGSLLAKLMKSVAKAGGLVKVIAPRIGGVLSSRNTLHEVHEKIGSAPSVLFDAVDFLPGQDSLVPMPVAPAFLTQTCQHCKYIGWSEGASTLVAVCGLSGATDDGFCALTDTTSAMPFVMACKTLRPWPREALFLP